MSLRNLFKNKIGVVKFADIERFYNWIFRNPVVFRDTVDFRNADIIEKNTFASEEEAIDAGLLPGDKFYINGVENTVTKIKQVLNFASGLPNTFGFLVDVSHLTPTEFYNEFFSGSTLTMSTCNKAGTLQNFNSSQLPMFNTLTQLTIGRGYVLTCSGRTSATIYGKPIHSKYKENIAIGNNIIAWVDEDTLVSTAIASYTPTISSIVQVVNGVQSTPTTFVKGRGYWFSASATTAEQGLPKLAGIGDPTIDSAYEDETAAIAGGVLVGQVWYNTTTKLLMTRLA